MSLKDGDLLEPSLNKGKATMQNQRRTKTPTKVAFIKERNKANTTSEVLSVIGRRTKHASK